jgi:para-nitrobenzyl esterase
LSTNSVLSDLLGDPRARAILEREVPDLVNSPQIGMASQMTLRALQPFMPKLLDDEALERIDRALTEQVR